MRRRRFRCRSVLAALALPALAACGHITETHPHGKLTLAHNEVRISVPHAPNAYVQSGGAVRIGTRTLALNATEATLARRYYRDARGIVAAGAAAGQAGGNLGASLIGSMFSAMWNDNASIIDRTAHAGAANVQASIAMLCARLADLQNTQNALSTALPAFAPYRIIGHAQVRQCLRGEGRHAHRSG